MSFSQHRRSIEKLIQEQFKILPIAWQNAPFRKPTDRPWIRVSVSNASTTRVSINVSKKVDRTVGLIQIQVFTPLNHGSYDADTISDTLAKIFRDTGIYEGITFLDSNLIPAEDTNGWYMAILNTEFWATDFH